MSLHDQRSRYSTPIATLMKAVSDIAGARTTSQAVELIRATARKLIGCEGITIVLRDGDRCNYVEEDAISALWKGQSFPAEMCVSGWSMINRQTVVIEDIRQDDRIPQRLYADTFVRAMAMVPVQVESPVGAIGAYWSKPYKPSSEEIDILEALANAAATAIENERIATEQGARLANGNPEPSVKSDLTDDLRKDVERVQAIAAVPAILDIVVQMTGMGFAAVARVTEDHWITCQSLDHLAFGLKPGDELPIESTICNEIRDHQGPVVIDNVSADPAYRDHHTPRIYGLQSYISVPIVLPNGQFFGTLCAVDPKPANVKNPLVIGTFKLFAELIGQHLDAEDRLLATRDSLEKELQLSEVREQFIAVLGHDLRNPLAAIDAGTSRLLKNGWTDRSPVVLQLMKASVLRMSGLVDNVMDLARARMGGGIALNTEEGDISATLNQVVEELRTAHPDRAIDVALELPATATVDHLRLAQMFSNLVSNAITHGAVERPILIQGLVADGHLQISFANGGIPIPAEQIDRLFLPFRRGEMTSSVQGLGLGLYIAAEIATAHGGKLEVTSDDRETRFTFKMPLVLK